MDNKILNLVISKITYNFDNHIIHKIKKASGDAEVRKIIYDNLKKSLNNDNFLNEIIEDACQYGVNVEAGNIRRDYSISIGEQFIKTL